MRGLRILRDSRGAAVIEIAFALPILILMIWMMVQLGLVYRANSGIQHALGEGARLATLYPQPADSAIEDRMDEAVYGIGPGNFEFEISRPEDDPDTADVDESDVQYIDLSVDYTQTTDMLLFPGPNITIAKTKRVWVAD
jgi:TadE-like protein